MYTALAQHTQAVRPFSKLALALALAWGLGALLVAPGVRAQTDPEELKALREQLAETRRELGELQRRLDRMSPPQGPRGTPEPGQRGAGSRLFIGGGERPMIGVVLRSANDGEGVRLAAVTPDGAADKAGLEAGDVLLTLDGKDLTGRGAVELAYKLLDDMEAGDRFKFTYRRDGQEKSAEVEAVMTAPAMRFSFSGSGQGPGVGFFGEDEFIFNLDEKNFEVDTEALKEWAEKRRDWAIQLNDGRWRRFAENFPGQGNGPVVWNLAMGWSSLKLAELNDSLAEYFGVDGGVLVIDSGLTDADLKGGDVITQVDGQPVSTPRDAMRILTRFDERETVTVTLVRHGAPMDVVLETPSASPGEFSFGYWYGDDD